MDAEPHKKNTRKDLLARDADETREAFSRSLLTNCRCQTKDRKCLCSTLTRQYDIDFLSAHQLSLLAHRAQEARKCKFRRDILADVALTWFLRWVSLFPLVYDVALHQAFLLYQLVLGIPPRQFLQLATYTLSSPFHPHFW